MPSASVILPVHNGASRLPSAIAGIREALAGLDEAEIVVALDGCTDDSARVLAGEETNGGVPVRMAVIGRRGGKSMAQNAAVERASGEVLVLTDVDTRFDGTAVRALLEPFQYEDVGYVAGNLGWRDQSTGKLLPAARFYTAMERRLWDCESRAGVLHVAPGAFMAVRRRLYRPLSADVGDDAMLPMDVLAGGARGVFAAEASATDEYPSGFRQEFGSRVRMTSRSLRATVRGIRMGRLWTRPHLLVAVVSHRLLRWGSPFLAVAGLGATVILCRDAALRMIGTPGFAIAVVVGVVTGLGTQRGRALVAGAWPPLVAGIGLAVGVLHYALGGTIRAYGDGSR